MNAYVKSTELKSIPFNEIRRAATGSLNNDMILKAISDVLNIEIRKFCSVEAIVHTYEYKLHLGYKTSEVTTEKTESPGNTLKRTDAPTKLRYFNYEELKRSATLSNGKYRGKLYGTVELYSCDKQMSCPRCSGTGICKACAGEKQIDCPVCHGFRECVSCRGTGKYTCTNCEGNGLCPECNEGWCTCETCQGDGEVRCPDCDGTGDFINEECNECGGSGYYRWDTECRVCHGTGRFVRECKNCEGKGVVDCDNCDGDGGWSCDECHGKGTCSHCKGKGYFQCKACSGSGKCGKCKGKGEIWCPDCHGKGICFDCKGEKLITCPRCNGTGEFQTYKEYAFAENETHKQFCTLRIDGINDINCDKCYQGVIYEFFAGRAVIFQPAELLDKVSQEHYALVKKWIELDNNSTFTKDKMNLNYLNITATLYRIPVSKFILLCNNKVFTILIVGYNKVVYYDNLPNFTSRIVGRIINIFK